MAVPPQTGCAQASEQSNAAPRRAHQGRAVPLLDLASKILARLSEIAARSPPPLDGERIRPAGLNPDGLTHHAKTEHIPTTSRAPCLQDSRRERRRALRAVATPGGSKVRASFTTERASDRGAGTSLAELPLNARYAAAGRPLLAGGRALTSEPAAGRARSDPCHGPFYMGIRENPRFGYRTSCSTRVSLTGMPILLGGGRYQANRGGWLERVACLGSAY
jgi:hypothetical protein